MTLFIALSLLSLVAVANLATLPVMFGVRAPDDNDIVKEAKSAKDLEIEKEILKIQMEQHKVLKQNSDEIRTQQQIRDKEVEIAEAIYKQQIETLKTNKQADAIKRLALNEELKALEARGASEELIRQKKEDIKNITIEQVQAEKALVDEAAKELSNAKTRVAVREQQKGALDDIFGTMLGIREGQKNILVDSIRSVKAGQGWGEQLNNVGLKVKAILDPMNIMASLGSKIWESTVLMAIAQDVALANLNKSVGAMGQFNDAASEAFVTSREFGVGFEEAAAAVQALHSSMAEFTELSKTAQKELTNFTAQMGQLGIESSTTAANLNIATKSLGLGVGEAQNMQKELFATAQAIGVAPKQLAEGFSSAAPQLAAHGDKMIGVFKEMAGAAKATGIEMSALLQIAGQFDTFEGAAQAAGNLNAILGGDLLNSVELLAATEEERIRMLIQSIQLSGKSWESMNKFERQAIASAAGITDMAQAGALFNQSLSAYDNQVAKSKQAAMSQEKMNEMMNEYMSILDKVKALGMSFAVGVRPVIQFLGLLLDIVTSVVSAMTGFIDTFGAAGKAIKSVVGVILSLVAVFFLWKKIILPIITLFKVAMGGVAALGPAVSASIAAQAAASTAAAPAFSALGAASGSAAVGLGLFALAAIGVGAAIALIGVGIAVIFFSIGSMMESMSKVSASQILSTALALGVLAAAMFAFSVLGGPLGFAAIAAIVVLSGLMAASMAASSHLDIVATSIRDIAKAVNELNETKLEALTMTMGIAAVAAPAFAIAAAPLAAIAGTTGTITTAATRGVVSKATPAPAPSAGTPAASTGETQPIIMKVKDRVLAEIIREHVKPMESAMKGKKVSPNWVTVESTS